MATYKLIQDIEAEDKILGPLTLRQFIFALIAVFFFYLSFIVLTKGVQFLLLLFMPPALFFGFFALPFGRDQPTEIWFLAKLRFWFVPRKRIWNQSGVKELVTITVPKKVERVLTNGLSEMEVKSRLQALANTIDSRGWAIKNVNVYTQPVAMNASDDRLIDLSSLPMEVPEDDTALPNDIMDPVNSPVAQQMNNLVYRSAQTHRQHIVDELNSKPQTYTAPAWFMGQGTRSVTPVQPYAPALSTQQPAVQPTISNTTPSATPIIDEAYLSKQLKQQANSQQAAYSHLRTMKPLGSQPTTTIPAQTPVAGRPTTPMTAPSDPAILALASNDDLNVATLAREAHKVRGDENQLTDEVVISLR